MTYFRPLINFLAIVGFSALCWLVLNKVWAMGMLFGIESVRCP